MSEKPLVSIIVPVYNSSLTLRACVESILRQQYQNIEVFLINDGSTDNSLSLCRGFEAFDDRVHVIDKPQSGVSACRNAGIECSTGKYIQFVDSDDHLTDDASLLLVERAENTGCDLVIADFYRVVKKKLAVKGNIHTDQLLDRRTFAEYLMENHANYYYGVLWNKLYLRSIIMDNDIRCCVALSCGEDALFNFDYIHYANSFCALQKPVYFYFRNKGSLCHTHSNPIYMAQMKKRLYEPYKAIFKSVDLYEKHRLKIKSFYIEMANDGTVRSAEDMLSGIKLQHKVKK